MESSPLWSSASHLRPVDSATIVELPADQSAQTTLWGWQRPALVASLFAAGVSVLVWPLATVIVLNGIATAAYLGILAFRFYATHRAERLDTNEPTGIHQAVGLQSDARLPIYTILCPLYHEADSVAQFLRGMRQLDYPF